MIKASDWMDRSSFLKDRDQEVDYYFEYEEEVSEEAMEIPQDSPPALVVPAPVTETVPQATEKDDSEVVSDDSRSDVGGADFKDNPVVEPQEDTEEASENIAGDDIDEVKETGDDLTVPQSAGVESTGVTPNEVPDDTKQEDEKDEATEDTFDVENHDGNDSVPSDADDKDQKQESPEGHVPEEGDDHDDTDNETIGNDIDEEDLLQASTKHLGESSLLNWKVFQV